MSKINYLSIGIVVWLQACATQPDQNISNVDASPYLILVSIDGLGWNLASHARTPALDKIASTGIRATAMRPVFPTMTFPNHYSIATGLHPGDHGIVDNSFPNADRSAWYHLWERDAVQDGRWYGGEPIWVNAEKHGITSAAYYFVGTEAAIGGISPTYWYPFDGDVPGATRIRQALDWLQLPEPQRPHLITLYFEDVDKASHEYGSGSPQTTAALELVDGFLAQLLDDLETLGLQEQVHLVVVSDHGQIRYLPDPPFILADHIDLDDMTIIDHGSFATVYFAAQDPARAAALAAQINSYWHHGSAYSREQAPVRWRLNDNPRFADVYIVAEAGFTVTSTAERHRSGKLSDHGWDNSEDDMRAIFMATGPRLPRGVVTGEISAVDVYPLMAEILGLPLPANVDARDNPLLPLLRIRGAQID